MFIISEIFGQVFECCLNFILFVNCKSKLVIGEDVVIFFKGELVDNNIKIEEENGEKVIII